MPPARLLDLTRLTSRLGRGVLTGVDRVELAWLEHLLALPGPLFGLVRTGPGFLLLGRGGAQHLARLARGEVPLGPRDLIGRLLHRADPLRARAEASVRRVAVARVPGIFLGRALRRHLPAGTSYFNTGHANLAPRVLRALRHVPGLRVAVLVHDTIPLDQPEFTRPGIPEVFARKLSVVATHADLVIHTTHATRAATETQLARLGRVPPGVVAPLGVPRPQPDSAALPAGLDVTEPYFVAVGTIEPRKNHALLLDVWALLAADGPPPRLFILGGRGWSNAAVFARLDAVPPPAGVTELAGIGDGAMAALVQGARALLFPSFAEGYGLPPVEAAALGVPVISADLPAVREVMGNYPVYLDASDSYSWYKTIRGFATSPDPRQQDRRPVAPPEWESHFNAVLNLI